MKIPKIEITFTEYTNTYWLEIPPQANLTCISYVLW